MNRDGLSTANTGLSRRVMLASVTSLILTGCGRRSGKGAANTADSSAPSLRVTTKAQFHYERFVQVMERMPVDPNTWRIQSSLTCDDPDSIEVLPVYLYSELSKDPGGIENANFLSPKSFLHAFTKDDAASAIVPPTDLSGQINTMVPLSLDQMDEQAFQALLAKGQAPAMIGTHTFTAALSVGGKPVSWGKLRTSSRTAIGATWEFGSLWASTPATRTKKTFEILHLGPVVRSTSGTAAYLVVAGLSCQKPGNGADMIQSSVRAMKVTADLQKDLTQTHPGHEMASRFGSAVSKLAPQLLGA